MLLSPSANRKKAKFCESCENYNKLKLPEICKKCYWAYPDDYEHIALQNHKVVELLWQDNDIDNFNKIKTSAEKQNKSLQEYIKTQLNKE